MKYCFDTSALIDLGERHYPERVRVFAPIWEFIYQGICNHNIVSVDYVKIELEKKRMNGELNFWRELMACSLLVTPSRRSMRP